MTDVTYNVMMPEKGVPIKAWTKGVPLESAARQELFERRVVLRRTPTCKSSCNIKDAQETPRNPWEH